MLILILRTSNSSAKVSNSVEMNNAHSLLMSALFLVSDSLGQKWRAHRKLIAPTFHLNVLKSFIELFNDNSRLVCKKMAALNGKTFDCHDYMSECTVETLLGELRKLFWQKFEKFLIIDPKI